MNRRYLFLALCAMGVIWFASGRPGDEIPLPGGWDKPAHFLGYAVLGFFLARALGETRPRWFPAWCLAVGYACSMSIISPSCQGDTLPERTSSWTLRAPPRGSLQAFPPVPGQGSSGAESRRALKPVRLPGIKE